MPVRSVIVPFCLLLLVYGAFAQQPRHGDEVWYAEKSYPSTFMPIHGMDKSESRRIMPLVHASLFRLDENLELVAQLAEPGSMEIGEKDGLVTYTVQIREDARFHDNSPVTAEDVKFTYEAMKNPKNNTPMEALLSNMEAVEVVAASTVRLLFHHADPANRMLLRYPILPRGSFAGDTYIPKNAETQAQEIYELNPVGAGPYKLTERGANSYTFSNTWPRFYSNNGPWLGRIKLRRLTSNTVIQKECELGNVDFWPDVPIAQRSPMQRLEAFSASGTYPQPGVTAIMLNNWHPFLKDVIVRRAIDYAIDKPGIIRAVYYEKADLITGPYTKEDAANNVSIRPREYNPEKADSLFIQAGFDRGPDDILRKDGVRFSVTLLYVREADDLNLIAYLIRDNLKRVGVEVEIRFEDREKLIQRTQYDHDFDMVIKDWDFGFTNDRYLSFHSSQTEPGLLNFAGYESKQADQLLEEARITSDKETRQQLLMDFHEQVFNDTPWIFLLSKEYFYALHRRFQGVTIRGVDVFQNVEKWYSANPLR